MSALAEETLLQLLMLPFGSSNTMSVDMLFEILRPSDPSPFSQNKNKEAWTKENKIQKHQYPACRIQTSELGLSVWSTTALNSTNTVKVGFRLPWLKKLQKISLILLFV